MTGYEKLVVTLPSGGRFILCKSEKNISFDVDDTEEFSDLPAGWRGIPSEAPLPPIQVKETKELRLLETLKYSWAYETERDTNITVESLLEQQRNWEIRGGGSRPPEGSFQVINFLGNSSIMFRSPEIEEVKLEFISRKIDYDQEYRQMTEDIAGFCEQLLLSVDSPTSLTFATNPEERKRLTIESFFFLRHFLSDDKLALLIEHIQRNPHRTLTSRKEWSPVEKVSSADHLSRPDQYMRDWSLRGGRLMASQALQVSREDSYDTPVNQFAHFALKQFRRLSYEVSLMHKASKSIRREASQLVDMLDAVVSQPFFRGISRLQKLPLNNQTLQKREGYRDLLRAWILSESASSLHWDGRKECYGENDTYEGNTRDVATLYEYWLFLELHKILDSISNMERLDTKLDDDFISKKDGELTVHLKRGQNSCSRFRYTTRMEQKLYVCLHYEKTFKQDSLATSGYSYSRQFRPDYTLSIYSADYASEQEATENGKVRHLHFDAKYKVENIQAIFGDDSEDLTVEKTEEKGSDNYKRGDLLKMHTYNDALRKTIGSYVLYPGEIGRKKYLKFHEIAPGVGAYAMKPGKPECSSALQGFIQEVLEHQSSQFTQYSYLDEAKHKTYSDEPTVDEETMLYNIARPSAKCVMLWIRENQMETFKEYGFAYCHAIGKDVDKTINLDLSTEIGSEFLPIEQTRKYLAGWRGKITGARFISSERLDKYYKHKTGRKRSSGSSASHYLLYEFKDVSKILVRNTSSLHSKLCLGRSKYMAVTCMWSQVLKCDIIAD